MHRKCIIISPKKRYFSLNDNLFVFSYKGQQLLNLINIFSKISWICCKIYSLKIINQKKVNAAHGFWINWKKTVFCKIGGHVGFWAVTEKPVLGFFGTFRWSITRFSRTTLPSFSFDTQNVYPSKVFIAKIGELLYVSLHI